MGGPAGKRIKAEHAVLEHAVHEVFHGREERTPVEIDSRLPGRAQGGRQRLVVLFLAEPVPWIKLCGVHTVPPEVKSYSYSNMTLRPVKTLSQCGWL